MAKKLLLCTDLDGTLLPNGQLPETPQARVYLSNLVAHPQIFLAYVSGRSKELVQEAILQYHLPTPDFVIADVGASLYEIRDEEWIFDEGWDAEIAHDWQGKTARALEAFLVDMENLTLQEEDKQGRYKLSYYYPVEQKAVDLVPAIELRLGRHGYQASVICSVHGEQQIGLLDILPPNASKRHAIEYLMRRMSLSLDEAIFAGDSGNDLSVATSPIPSVLVANASSDVKEEARRVSLELGHEGSLYIAQGNLLGMNGNYAAGILEGVAHFYPELMALIDM